MACNYSIQLMSLRGLPIDSGLVVLEVIVRTPRLLSTLKQNYASEPFAVHAARGVTLHWTQTKAAKAYVRLRVLPAVQVQEDPMASTAVGVPAMTGLVCGMLPPPATAVTITPAIAGATTAKAPPSEGLSGIWGERKSVEGLLQLTLTEQQQQGAHSTVAAQVQQLVLALEQETGGGDKAGGSDGMSSVAAVDVDILVLPGKGGVDDVGTAASANTNAGHVAVNAVAATSGAPAPQAWAWAEAVSPPAPAPSALEHPPPSSAPRKRSWFLALGFGWYGCGGGGAEAAATPAAAPEAEDAARGGICADPVLSTGSGGPAALTDTASQGTSVWDPVAAVSSVTTTTTGAATTVATVSSSSLIGASSAAGGPCRLQEPGGDARSWTGAPPLPGRRRQSKIAPGGSGSLPGNTMAAAAPPPPQPLSPFAPLSLTAGELATANVPLICTAKGSTVTAALPPPPPLVQAIALASDPSSCSEVQQPKRRRLGEFLARLFHHTASNNQVRRITRVETSLQSIGPVGGGSAGKGAQMLARALAGPGDPGIPPTSGAASAKSLLRRNGSPIGLTVLAPPSPRLGDVYRVQDNALASETSVQIGFNTSSGDGNGVVAAAAAATNNTNAIGAVGVAAPGHAGELRPSSILLPGLESPGYGEDSPAEGPNRLTIEPPVEGMEAATLSSPMATSPVTPAGGCFFWRYGAAARSRAAAAAGAAAPAPAPGSQPLSMAAAVAIGCLRRVGSAPVPGSAAAAAGPAGSQLKTLSAAEALPTASSTSVMRQHSSDKPCPGNESQHQQQVGARGQAQGSQLGLEGGLVGAVTAPAAAADGGWSHPIEGEISRVVQFVSGQTGLEEEMREVALSQCQFLLDCLRNPDMFWLVGDSLLQLKHEVGFPFDTGVPIPGAPGWFQLVLQPLHAPPAAALAAGATPSLTGPPCGAQPPAQAAPEVLRVRWSCIDQRQIGGTNACAAIGLEVAAWCLGSVKRWRQAVTAATASAAAISCATSSGGGGCTSRRDATVWPQPLPHSESSAGRWELASALSRSQRDRERERVAASIDMEEMSGNTLEQCIRAGTEVWQAVLVQSPASRVASSTGDFDLEHMLQLGGYSQRLRLADYSAASLLEDESGGGGGGGSPRRCSFEVATVTQAPAAIAEVPPPLPSPPPPAKAHSTSVAAAAATALMFPSAAPGHSEDHIQQCPPALQLPLLLDSPHNAHGPGLMACDQQLQPQPPSSGIRHGLPTFAMLVRSLTQGVYILGWRGHFATLWLRPGGVVHLIDSLGTRLAADCPLAFVLDFDSPSDFLAFFLARHQARHDDAAADDIAGANMAALIEVHRLEMVHPAAPPLVQDHHQHLQLQQQYQQQKNQNQQ